MNRPHLFPVVPALLFALAGLLIFSPAARALTPAPLWVERFGSTGSDIAYDAVVDGAGNIIVVGSFTGSVDFGGGALTSAGGADIFIAKYDATGAHVWSKRFGSTGDDVAKSVAHDIFGGICVVGYFTGTVNFGGVNIVSAGGASDYFIAYYNSSGVHNWSKGFGGNGTDIATGVAMSTASDVFVTGTFQGSATLGNGGHFAAGGADSFIEKYNSAGTNQWTKQFGSTLDDGGASVAVDGSGNVITTGFFQNTVNFGGSNLVSAGNTDIYFAKYNGTGTHQWSFRYGSTSGDAGTAVALDASGNVVLAGTFNTTIDFGGGTLVSAGNSDAFVAGFTSAGAFQWNWRFGGTTFDSPLGVAVDATGNVLASGEFSGTATYAGGSLTSAGIADGWFARFDPTGTPVWIRGFGGTGSDKATSINPDLSGNAVVTGYFANSVDPGLGTVTSAGSNDIFLAEYTAQDASPAITSVTDIGNDQGRKVRIWFDRSVADAGAISNPVTHYVAYRRADPTPAASSGRGGASRSEGRRLASGWVEVGSAEAFGESEYGIDVPTVGDSTIALGQYYSVFYIRAATEIPTKFYDSLPDSGYSVDNLAPGVPQNFVYAAGNLSWDESTAADFDYFTVYGANTDDFGAATIVDYSVSPALDVTASPYAYYYVTATDFSGNEGKPNSVNALSGVNGTPKHYVLSLSNFPNPFNPRTTVSYTVPSRGHVTIGVYDASGAHVATLFDGERDAGAYSVGWDGRGAGGAVVSSGIYFARIQHASGTRTKKMVLLK
ncbi:MAG TPA: T9SS type A sorting domain-containing protein [Candidatus Krumholzibacteria bacterium]|nr:T9SS type A sorting domain-containing protein [Candidatus Krumholzibacteria bacterium]